MKLSTSFVKPLKQAPSGADTRNHELLVQAGYVRQLMAGVYSYLPWGLAVLRNISQIVREEMNSIDGQEILMPMLHPSEIWQTTGGWDSIDVLFKIKSRTEREYALGQSQEEVVTPLVKEMIQSYKDLPTSVYHIQWKFRDELRSKSGILRGREFLMKDMYSFHQTPEDFEDFYTKTKQAYLRVFTRLGLVAKATEASGGSFSDKISYEFMVITDAGEDDILYCPACDFCVNVEIAKQHIGDACPSCEKESLLKARASEVGNVFDLGQKYAKDFDFTYVTANDERAYPYMGCYGIGISRTMGVIVERFNDQKGIIWPESVAPFDVHLISLAGAEEEAERAYAMLKDNGVSVLWDDREESAGSKFAVADLLGMPVRLVISKRTNGQVEWKRRVSSDTEVIDLEQAVQRIKKTD